MREQIVLRIVSKMVIPYILVFGFYVITHGERGPGGGFQGGVILASAYILYCLIFGLEAGRRVLPPRLLDILVAIGLFAYATVGWFGILGAEAFLDYRFLQPSHPQEAGALGITLVENGIGITVAAVMVRIFNRIAGHSTAESQG